MLKNVLIAVALSTASLLSIADPLVVEPASKFSVPAVADKCKEGCLILDGKDLAELEKAINDFAKRAFEAGRQHERKTI